LGHRSLDQGLLAVSLALVMVSRGRKDKAAQWPGEPIRQKAVGFLEGFPEFRKLDRQIGHHIDILGTLTRKQEGQLASYP
jgi:hypothetical protein